MSLESVPTVPSGQQEAATAERRLLTGRVLSGRYEVRDRLGNGGMGDVYRAVDLCLGRAVAVKVFRPGCGLEFGERRFHSEVWTLASVQHPSLVTLYDAGVDQDESYLVLQLVRGPTLADRLREGPLPPAEVARTGAALADALACVHAHGIMHRDVKPANVLLDGDGGVYLADFGIACMQGVTGLTATGTLVGTAAYLAPEQVGGQAVDAPADVYALGLVLLECLTGRREYQGGVIEVALARLYRAPDIPEQLGAQWCALLRAMTGREPARRPTAGAVATRLRRMAAGTAAAGPVPDGEAARRWGRWSLAAAIAACLAVLAAASLVSFVQPGRGGQTRPPPQADRPAVTAPPGDAASTPKPTTGTGPVDPTGSTGRRSAAGGPGHGGGKADRHGQGPSKGKKKGHGKRDDWGGSGKTAK